MRMAQEQMRLSKKEELDRLTKANVLEAITEYERNGYPAGYGKPTKLWLKHPEQSNNSFYPQKVIFGLVLNYDNGVCPSATTTRERFKAVGFEVFSFKSSKVDAVDVEKVRASLQGSREQRAARLENAPEYPARVVQVIEAFRRNPDVIAERLDMADGKCENCEQAAPFIGKSTNEPYLEVHHIKPLSDGGKDTVCNTRALCPNCHREVHFGRGAIEFTSECPKPRV